MRAVVCDAWGPPEALVVEDLPAPESGAVEALVRIRACGVNFADALIVQGKYQEKLPLPFTPDLEVAGDVFTRSMRCIRLLRREARGKIVLTTTA